jgi:hypothetical protein
LRRGKAGDRGHVPRAERRRHRRQGKHMGIRHVHTRGARVAQGPGPLLLGQYLQRRVFVDRRAEPGRQVEFARRHSRHLHGHVGDDVPRPAHAPRRADARVPRREGLRVHERGRERPLQRDVGLAERLLQRRRRFSLHALRVPLSRDGERHRHVGRLAGRRQDPLHGRHQAGEVKALTGRAAR